MPSWRKSRLLPAHHALAADAAQVRPLSAHPLQSAPAQHGGHLVVQLHVGSAGHHLHGDAPMFTEHQQLSALDSAQRGAWPTTHADQSAPTLITRRLVPRW